MDELELNGRRHISAKRAAREHRYHSDYIGQLIRGGKVRGQKVGRSWYVDAESLDAYLKGEPVAAPLIRVDTIAPAEASAPETTAAEVVQEQPTQEMPEPQIGEPEETKIEIKKEEPDPTPAPHIDIPSHHAALPERVGLRFVADDPFVPEPAPQAPAVSPEAVPLVSARAKAPWTVIGAAAALVVAIAAGASTLTASKMVVNGQTQSASIYFGLPE